MNDDKVISINSLHINKPKQKEKDPGAILKEAIEMTRAHMDLIEAVYEFFEQTARSLARICKIDFSEFEISHTGLHWIMDTFGEEMMIPFERYDEDGNLQLIICKCAANENPDQDIDDGKIKIGAAYCKITPDGEVFFYTGEENAWVKRDYYSCPEYIQVRVDEIRPDKYDLNEPIARAMQSYIYTFDGADVDDTIEEDVARYFPLLDFMSVCEHSLDTYWDVNKNGERELHLGIACHNGIGIDWNGKCYVLKQSILDNCSEEDEIARYTNDVAYVPMEKKHELAEKIQEMLDEVMEFEYMDDDCCDETHPLASCIVPLSLTSFAYMPNLYIPEEHMVHMSAGSGELTTQEKKALDKAVAAMRGFAENM